ncbi:hypothetical protein BDK51DRAFT_35076 [Blyttiomyces helicus]|uniref:Uncharacterized protein n=1 Tax=Blyttiomyces helicus TaxID=388810 RepID=A0A4P9WKD7_9FUNG|nr:hypothetical protein BDK51DRAFT_35076 [Blyttiomyces helicus]|eukprot:RKO92862.1 hypothetical protein BDK51DRAFT_35076 [Blyttiomyces helicus]
MDPGSHIQDSGASDEEVESDAPIKVATNEALRSQDPSGHAVQHLDLFQGEFFDKPNCSFPLAILSIEHSLLLDEHGNCLSLHPVHLLPSTSPPQTTIDILPDLPNSYRLVNPNPNSPPSSADAQSESPASPAPSPAASSRISRAFKAAGRNSRSCPLAVEEEKTRHASRPGNRPTHDPPVLVHRPATPHPNDLSLAIPSRTLTSRYTPVARVSAIDHRDRAPSPPLMDVPTEDLASDDPLLPLVGSDPSIRVNPSTGPVPIRGARSSTAGSNPPSSASVASKSRSQGRLTSSTPSISYSQNPIDSVPQATASGRVANKKRKTPPAPGQHSGSYNTMFRTFLFSDQRM